ncbi:MAG TPA: metallothionein [Thermoanaerobaculia bacterium]
MACEHRGCHCQEEGVNRQGKHFCSEACADAQLNNRHEANCRCGHPDCRS